MVAEFLEWDSAFFERRVARVRGHRLDAVQLAAIEAWCASNRIDVLYFLADADDPLTTRLAERSAFRLADIRLTLERTIRPADSALPPTPGIRPATEADIPALRAIAAGSYTDSRFFYDQRFPPGKAAELYAIWVEKSVRGSADAVRVAAGEGDSPAGYITCHLNADGAGEIGLVGVAEAARGAGVGRQLVEAAVRWFAQQGARAVSVVTQGRNVPAQRLYQRSGFVTHSVQLWYHRWFSEE